MYILFAIVLGFAIFVGQSYLYKKTWKKDLNVDAFFKVEEAIAGEESELTETIENAKGLPLPMVKMKLQLSKKLLFRDTDNSTVSDYFYRTDIYHIGAYQKVKRTIKFTCAERGYYDFHGIDVISTDLLYTKEFIKSVDATSHLYVYPKPYDPTDIDLIMNRINGETLTKRRVYEDPFELRGIREYQTYDSLKNVNWKASAKTDDLMVNVHDSTAERQMRLFLDLEDATLFDDAEIKELCISMASSISEKLCLNNIRVSLYSNTVDSLSGNPIVIDSGSGKNHIRTINRSLARADLSKKVLSFKDYFDKRLFEEDKNTFTIIISGNMQSKFQEYMIKYKETGADFVWICPVTRRTDFEICDGIRDKVMTMDIKEALYEMSLH